jgi:hypothetical protein
MVRIYYPLEVNHTHTSTGNTMKKNDARRKRRKPEESKIAVIKTAKYARLVSEMHKCWLAVTEGPVSTLVAHMEDIQLQDMNVTASTVPVHLILTVVLEILTSTVDVIVIEGHTSVSARPVQTWGGLGHILAIEVHMSVSARLVQTWGGLGRILEISIVRVLSVITWEDTHLHLDTLQPDILVQALPRI